MKAHLRLSMDQDINIKLFLEFYYFADFILNCLIILFCSDLEENKIAVNKN